MYADDYQHKTQTSDIECVNDANISNYLGDSLQTECSSSAHLQRNTLQACVCYFLSNLYFSLNDGPSKAMKNVFFRSYFRSQDIQIFVFLSSFLFLPVSHCFRG